MSRSKSSLSRGESVYNRIVSADRCETLACDSISAASACRTFSIRVEERTGFSMKSVAPSFMVSMARRTVAEPVMIRRYQRGVD